MREEILKTIKLQNGKLTFKNLHKKFDIGSEELQDILHELKLDGEILQVSNKYMIFPEDLLMGNISVSSSGKKFIFYGGERISVASNFFDDVFLGDVVSFIINDNNEAEITTIIDRTLGDMTCTVMNINGKKKIIPYHNGVNITLPKEVTESLVDGDIILVNIQANDIGEYCDAKFIKRIGNRNDPGKLEETIAINYGFDNDYSPLFLEEIENYPTSVSDEEIKNRYDFRYQNSCTIDGADTKDMDDGLYGEMLDNGNIRVYVHIADVSHYVKPGSLVFERACEKATSAYLNNSVFHMLHYKISNGICSLNPYEDRLTKTVIMDIDPNGNIVDFSVVKSVINSKKKMTYDEVDKILLNEEVLCGYESFVPTLEILNIAALRLEAKAINENGKLEFANNDSNNTYNSDGSIHEINENKEHSPSEKLIENLMIAANKTVATWLFYLGMPSIYRVHELPNMVKINAAIDIMNESGFNIRHVHNVDTPQEIQKLLNKLKTLKEFPILSQMLVMAMQRARYSTDNLGHFALGEEAYTHFTSPIRRLPDLLVHMIIDLMLENYDKIDKLNLEAIEKGLEELSKHASKMERQADAAEKDAGRALVIQKMEKHIGEELEAVVCVIDKKIRIKVWGIDTYIDAGDLSDNFSFDSSSKFFYDKDTGKHLKLGTHIIVKLTEANSVNRSFKVKVLAPVNEKVKKRALIKN